jgi:hypothetical protein
MMNASGNRGDDIRALRLCEMQPYQFLHPNGETTIPAVLGLQSDMEQKARSKGMKTVSNSSSLWTTQYNINIDHKSDLYMFYST